MPSPVQNSGGSLCSSMPSVAIAQDNSSLLSSRRKFVFFTPSGSHGNNEEAQDKWDDSSQHTGRSALNRAIPAGIAIPVGFIFYSLMCVTCPFCLKNGFFTNVWVFFHRVGVGQRAASVSVVFHRRWNHTSWNVADGREVCCTGGRSSSLFRHFQSALFPSAVNPLDWQNCWSGLSGMTWTDSTAALHCFQLLEQHWLACVPSRTWGVWRKQLLCEVFPALVWIAEGDRTTFYPNFCCSFFEKKTSKLIHNTWKFVLKIQILIYSLYISNLGFPLFSRKHILPSILAWTSSNPALFCFVCFFHSFLMLHCFNQHAEKPLKCHTLHTHEYKPVQP